jgi:hypothetical protein
VPSNAAISSCEELIDLSLFSKTVHKMDLWVTFWCAAGWVDVMTAKETTELQSLGDWQIRKILVSECYNLSLGDKEGELGLTGIRKLAELNTCDLRSSTWSKLLDLGSFDKEILEGWVGSNAMLHMVKWLEWCVFLIIVPSGEVVRILMFFLAIIAVTIIE